MKKILSQLEKRFTSDIWQRGKGYYKEGLIDKIVKSGDIITAVSYGNSTYRLKINLKTKETSCSCPCDFECKHLAALVIWLKNNKAIDSADFANTLKFKTKEELISILCNLLEKKPELWIYAQTLDKNAIIDLIKKIWFPKGGDDTPLYNQLDYIKKAIFKKKDFSLGILLLRKLIDLFDHGPESHELMDYIDSFLDDLHEEKLSRQQSKDVRNILKSYPFDF
ncbi:MAG: hypothetical protein KKA79_01750 [Nanoarchaeota archaeon]|nr:hypothetical protein [Nanoarchaeota archaeon]